ncbi:hypothetical protein [Hoeflea alexandrii]|uniref:Uncharacterized protein n=1 Tax=Hoeflea alexandrii TaxID=288436 RepID=A0ABT1CLX7_9HYPH|nr:hypothetical protein [Hoeflea alexandrii]MCO6407167.1 hypothetical protein [Hoeflea alexandrii]
MDDADIVGTSDGKKFTFDQAEIEELQKIFDAQENSDGDKGRKDYCCRWHDGSKRAVRASNSVSAMLKCQKHKPGKPVSVSRGNC